MGSGARSASAPVPCLAGLAERAGPCDRHAEDGERETDETQAMAAHISLHLPATALSA